METELKPMNPDPQKPDLPQPGGDNGSSKDDRPLLKSESSRISNENHLLHLDEMEKKFAAFVRHDVYGTNGRGELPLVEKVLLGIALVTLVPIRVVLAMGILVFYYVICRICTLFLAPNREEVVEGEELEDFAHMGGWRREVIVLCGRFLSRLMLFVFGFYWINETYRDTQPPPQPQAQDSKSSAQDEGKDEYEERGRPGAIISNHVSYIDILYHMSTSFPSFVAKRSVAKLPLVGLISKCLGCVYVQRESKSSDFKGVAGVVTERVEEAYENRSAPMMMLFPEGTTTNGDFLLPFKTGAFLARVPVLPVILRYPYQRLSVAWDSISGVRHVILLLCQFVNHMEVTRLPVYHPSQEEKGDPKLYANNVRRLMADEGSLIMSDIGLAEKRIYLGALNENYEQRWYSCGNQLEMYFPEFCSIYCGAELAFESKVVLSTLSHSSNGGSLSILQSGGLGNGAIPVWCLKLNDGGQNSKPFMYQEFGFLMRNGKLVHPTLGHRIGVYLKSICFSF